MKKITYFLLLLSLFGCVEDRKRKELEAAGCKFQGTADLTDEPKRYCGKACFRYVHRDYYVCGKQGETYPVHFDY